MGEDKEVQGGVTRPALSASNCAVVRRRNGAGEEGGDGGDGESLA